MMEFKKIEFDLTVRVSGEKMEDQYPTYGAGMVKEPEIVVLEELNFKSLSPSSVIRKILDYLER